VVGPSHMIRGVRGRTGIAALTTLMVVAGAMGASAKQLRFGRCALTPRARVVARTPEVVLSYVPHTEVVDAVNVTNPTYYTCLRRTGERHQLFAASSDPSPDAGYQSYLAAIRAAGDYVLYVSAFTQDNPDGPTTGSAIFHVIDVADHDRQTLTLPDPNYGLIGLGEVAISVDGYMAWAQVNPQASVTTEAVEADTGGGAITIASAPIADTLTRLAFHKLAFRGETLTWLDDGRRQSEQLKPYTLGLVVRTRHAPDPGPVRTLPDPEPAAPGGSSSRSRWGRDGRSLRSRCRLTSASGESYAVETMALCLDLRLLLLPRKGE
jgi:hypothetical protein